MVLDIVIVIVAIVAFRCVPHTALALLLGTFALLIGAATAVLGIVVAVQNCHLPGTGWGIAGLDLHRMHAYGWAAAIGCLFVGSLGACFGALAVRHHQRAV